MKTHTQRHRRCRGSAYVLVLGTTMLVTLLGVSALLAVQVERATQQGDEEGARAALLAQSAVELALLETFNDGWRNSRTSGAWSEPVALGGGAMRFRFIDPDDGDLDDDAGDSVIVEGEGAFGSGNAPRTRRRASLVLDPHLRSDPLGPSIIADGSMNSTANWYAYPAGQAEVELNQSSGDNYIKVKKRNISGSSIRQNLTARLVTPGRYDVSAEVEMANFTEDFVLNIHVLSGGAWRVFSRSWRVGTSTATVSGRLEITWDAPPTQVVLEMLPASSDQSFELDDVTMRLWAERPAPVMPGSWRRVVLSE